MLHTFKKIEGNMTMIKREMEDIFKNPNGNLNMKNSVSEITQYFQYLQIY